MTTRALFHDEEPARSLASRLVRDGFSATVERARFAGEDDDEDQPWSVVTDAPDAVLEVAAEALEGWVEHDDEAPPTSSPLPLPTEPVRFKAPPH